MPEPTDVDYAEAREIAGRCLAGGKRDCPCEPCGKTSRIAQALAERSEPVSVLRTALEKARPWLEHSAPPEPGHVCGPDRNCDMDCANHAAWVEMWTAVEKALRDSRAVAAWEALELLRAAADVAQHDPWAYEKGKYPRVLWRRLKAAVERARPTSPKPYVVAVKAPGATSGGAQFPTDLQPGTYGSYVLARIRDEVACPKCHAEAGAGCRDEAVDAMETRAHVERIDVWLRQA